MGPFRFAIKEAWETAFLVAKCFCVLHVTDNYLINPVIVSMIPLSTYNKFIFMINNWSVPILQTYGPSMLPTIDATPTIFLTERISTRFGKVAHGDIVVLRLPHKPRQTVAKRLVGLEGDIITYVSSPENSDKLETVEVCQFLKKN
jgi:inner membrane protease subunit 1